MNVDKGIKENDMHLDSVGSVLGLMKVRFWWLGVLKKQWWANSVCIPWALVGNADSRAHSGLLAENPWGGPSHSCFDTVSQLTLGTTEW